MCFKNYNVEYLDPPARQSSFKSEATTILVPPRNALKEAKAAVKAEKKAKREREATLRRKTMYGAGGGAAYIGVGAAC